MSDAIRAANDANGVLRITLARPAKANALRRQDVTALILALEQAETEAGIRAVLLDAEGKNFCGGADLVAANPRGAARPALGDMSRNLATAAHRLVHKLWELPTPTVAAVQGSAIGLGLHLALACDFVVAGESSRFREPFAQRGFCPDSGATYLLPRLVGVARAKQMLMRGTVVRAGQALDWGLVAEVVPDGELSGAAEAIATELAAGPTFVHGLTKTLISDHLTSDLPRALAAEARGVELTLRGEDFKEGIHAFLEHRPPVFTGR